MRSQVPVRTLIAVGFLAAVCSSAVYAADPPQRPGMAYIPAGPFMMGSKADDPIVFDHEKHSEQPQHEVVLKAFYIDKTEVTNKQFDEVTKGHVRDERSTCDDCPVTTVTWFEARAYCDKLKKRLPTEAEWEKAAKGGTEERPTKLFEYAWYNANALQGTKPVGKLKPNGYGIYDMLGNVREWTNDWFDPSYYQHSPKENPPGPETGERHVERGGAFFLPDRSVTSTIRYNHPPTFRLYFLGFRCAQDP
jgi:formylglycine-generating enzyme required for sulfatase activity